MTSLERGLRRSLLSVRLSRLADAVGRLERGVEDGSIGPHVLRMRSRMARRELKELEASARELGYNTKGG